MYFGNGKLGPGAFDDCTTGVAAFHDYSIGSMRVSRLTYRMPQRIKTNHLNESYFFFPSASCGEMTRRSDAGSARKSTCQQLRSYMRVPIDGYGSPNKLWVRNNYRVNHYDVVILNGPCKGSVVKYLLRYLTPDSLVIVLGTNVKAEWSAVSTLRSELTVVEESSNKDSLGYIVFRK